jgi:3-oxoacyl-[acyl-carrier-protein] synthase II
MGMLTALGNDVDSTWRGMVAGRSGIGTIEAFDPSRLAARIAGEVHGFDASHILDRKEVRRTDRYIQFGLVASREAMDRAGLPARLEGQEAERTGVILGTGLGGVGTLVEGISINALRGPDRISPFLIPMGIPNVGAGQVAISFGMTGPNFTTVSACATGGHAIGEAYETIRRADADTMIAGGSEAGVYEPLVGGFDSMRALSRRNDDPARASRPFDAGRDGFVMGEGAAVLVLEELEHARARGASIYAELAGYGVSSDSYHMTEPDPAGAGQARAIRAALDDAGVDEAEVDYVNAHASSTDLGDATETAALKLALGDAKAHSTPVSSIKGATGHCLGAAGAIEAIATVLAVRDDVVPPTINYETVDPACDLDYVPNTARRLPVRVALSNSFGFGGHNAVIVFREHENGAARR